jgi:hypothetical protein
MGLVYSYKADPRWVQTEVIGFKPRIVISVEGSDANGFEVTDWVKDPAAAMGYTHRTFGAANAKQLEKKFGINLDRLG